MSRSYYGVIGGHVYEILASTTHGVDIYDRVFHSVFGASVIAPSEDSIFLVRTPNDLVRTPNDLVLFPGYAEYQVLLDRTKFSNFWILLNLFRIFLHLFLKLAIYRGQETA